MAACPKPVGSFLPALGVWQGLGAKMLNAFRALIIRVHGSGGFNHFAQTLRIFQHRAGAEHIAVEGLIVMVSHEQRASQCVKQ